MISQVHLKLIGETPNSSLSTLRYNGEHVCFILEDGHRDVKVWGNTRIPAGEYEIVRRYAGRHFQKYSARFGHKHTFMLKDVPNFKWIMVHIGNKISDTDGCLLTGMGGILSSSGNYETISSSKAYGELVYPLLTELTEAGNRCFIRIER